MDFTLKKTEKNEEEKTQSSAVKSFVAYKGGILMVIVSGLFIALAYFMFLAPKVADIFLKKEAIAGYNSEIESLETQLARFRKLEEEYNSIDQQKIDKIESLVTVSPDLPNLYIQIEQLGKQNGVVIDSINAEVKTDAKEEDSGLGVVQMSIKVSDGSYSSLKSLLEDFEKNLRILDIEMLSFPEKIDAFNIELLAYYIR